MKNIGIIKGLLKCIIKKNKLFKKYKKSHLSSDEYNYKLYKRHLNIILSKAEKL